MTADLSKCVGGRRPPRQRLCSRGTFTALVTPFKNDEIDVQAFERLIETQIAAGISGIVPVGTTGESPTLSCGERHHVIELAVKSARRPLPRDRRHRLQFDPGRDRAHEGSGGRSARMARFSSRPITTSRARKGFSGISPPSPKRPRSSSCSTISRAAARSTSRPTPSSGWRRTTRTSSRSRRRAGASTG